MILGKKFLEIKKKPSFIKPIDLISLQDYSYLIITCKPKPSQPSTTGNVNVCQG